jgi:hypothetical protein
MICDIVYDQQDVIFTTDIDLKKFSAGKELYVSYEKDTEDNFDLRFLVLRKKKLGNEHRVTMHSDRSFRVHDIKEESEYNFMKKFYYRNFGDEILFFELHSGNLYPALDGTKNLPEKINNKIIYYSDKYLYEKKAIFDSFHQENLKYYTEPTFFIFRAHYLNYNYLDKVTLEQDEIDFLNKGFQIYLSEPILTMDVDSIIHEEDYKKNILNNLSDFVKRNKLTNVTVNLCEGNFPKKANLYPGLKFRYSDIFLRMSSKCFSEFDFKHHFRLEKKFCSPNWIFRTHRHIIASYLSNKDSFISWPHFIPNGRYEFSDIFYNDQFEFHRENEEFPKFLKDKDPIIYDELINSSQYLDEISPIHLDNNVLINNDENDYTRQTNNGYSVSLGNYYMKSFCGIITETVFDYPFSNVSEKSLLPILYKRPFILVATRESLKALKSLGFKTFECLWDESYDNEWSCNLRMYKILKLIQEIENTPLYILKEKLSSIKDILDHNYNLLLELHERT